jgi:hypothetical protein
MSLSPPPYTRVPLLHRNLDADTIKLRLQRFFIDKIAFLYEVDHDALVQALRPDILNKLDDNQMRKTDTGSRFTIVTLDERIDFLYLANIVREASGKALKHQVSLITDLEYKTIYHHVVIPALGLSISPPYAFYLLQLHAKHQGLYRRYTDLFTCTSPQESSFLRDSEIAHRLVSDGSLA